jgi:uncharacterized membrane protein YgdD (TMEM256/DUF423 family)
MKIRISAVMGFLAVSLGAFAAHGLKSLLEANAQIANWNTAAQYHLIHSVALLALAISRPQQNWAWRFWFLGTIIFSGSLYIMGLTGQRWLGAITPIGGVLLLAGWLALAIKPEPSDKK